MLPDVASRGERIVHDIQDLCSAGLLLGAIIGGGAAVADAVVFADRHAPHLVTYAEIGGGGLAAVSFIGGVACHYAEVILKRRRHIGRHRA